jgi:hypothetical protein
VKETARSGRNVGVTTTGRLMDCEEESIAYAGARMETVVLELDDDSIWTLPKMLPSSPKLASAVELVTKGKLAARTQEVMLVRSGSYTYIYTYIYEYMYIYIHAPEWSDSCSRMAWYVTVARPIRSYAHALVSTSTTFRHHPTLGKGSGLTEQLLNSFQFQQ